MSDGKSLPSSSAADPRPGMPSPASANDKGASVDHGGKSIPGEPAKAAPSLGPGFLRRRRLVLGTCGVLALAAALWFGVPWVRFTLGTVSTDDAFVNGHATFVAPRVHGQVSRVLVDDNNRVKKGDLLVQLDKEPFQDAVAVKKAAVDTAQADLDAANATVRGIEAQARSRRWNLQHAMEEVENQISLLRARVAGVEMSKASLKLAELEFERAKQLITSATTTQQEYDRRQAALTIARAQVTQSLADVYQIRVSLGLPAQPEKGGDLAEVPPDLDQTFSSVLAGAGGPHSERGRARRRPFLRPDAESSCSRQFEGQGDIDTTFARLAADAPAVKQAEAKLEAAKRDLALAELDLRYCDIVAEIDGVVTRRNVNPGNDVQVGQSLMAIRSLDEIWVDANFKETQLRDLRIGQSVDLYVDMYGDRQVFNGRIAGFTMGTGSTLALLPAQNATGNFVKIVQRLPVRIELEGLRPGQKAPVPRHLGCSLRLSRQAAGRTRCRQVSPRLRAAVAGHRFSREPLGRRQMSEAVLSPARSRAGGSPWVVAAAVVVPTFMEVLDTTITLVALRYIAGGLSATVNDGEWVITSYLAANAIILPITGWLSAHLGRRNYFLLSIAVFTLASALCGMATSLGQLIAFRVVQGLAGGGLQPSSQGVLLDAFPREKQGIAMTLFGFAALLAPIVGPTLGGWITDSYSWRWVFFINVPVGLAALAACTALLRDPDYLTKEREELKKQPFRFDTVGLSLLVIVMVSWEVMLSKGQEWDWLNDPFGRVQTLVMFFAVGLVALIWWELRHANPVVNFRPMRERNFSACCLIIFCIYLVLYAASTSLPGLLQSLFGYDALSAGLVMSPGGILCGRRNARRGPCAGPGDGRPVGDDHRFAGHDRRQLLDVAAQPRHQPEPGGVASGGAGSRSLHMFRACERRGLPLHTTAAARRRHRPVEPAAQRGRQCGDFDGADGAGAP